MIAFLTAQSRNKFKLHICSMLNSLIIFLYHILQEAGNIGNISEVDLNTKFLFIVLGPKSHLGHCAEMCRCMATLFTDEVSNHVYALTRETHNTRTLDCNVHK